MSGRSPSPTLPVALLREHRYRKHFLREDNRQTAITLITVAVAYAASASNDFQLLQPGALRVVSLAGRFLLVLALGAALVLLRRARWPRQQQRALTLAFVATAVFMSVVHLTKISSGQPLSPAIASGVYLGILYFAQRGPLLVRALVGTLITIVGVTILVASQAQNVALRPLHTTAALSLVAIHVIGILSARSFEENRRKRFEAERRERHARQDLALKLRELAVEKDRAEAMSRARAAFLAAMSHELRTPMNAVIGLSDLLLDAPLAAEHWSHVRTISDSARALLGLLNDVLDFAKIDAQNVSLSPAPFDLHRLVGSVADMLRPTASARSIELTVDLSPAVPRHVLGDDARLRQVLVNLVSNAVKFTERGAVTLAITASALPNGDHQIFFRVEDTGIGMTPEVIARLFRPFEQADGGIARRFGGTGLGLAVSKQIVVAMGGEIHVESEPDRGSVFSFALRLPAASPRAEASGAVRREERPPLAILVVDDHPINREVARHRLDRLGYPVDLAPDGPAAIEAVSKKDYDLIFMDLHMPGMGGIEATARIRQALAGRAAPHVVAMTASVFEEDRQACRDAGMSDFVGKPIDPAQLDAVLRRVAEERGAHVPVEPPTPAPAKDRLAALKDLGGSADPHFFSTLVHLFLADLDKRLPRIEQALTRADAPALRAEAHTLKSSSATLGAAEMSRLCGVLEGAAHTGCLDDLGDVLRALLAERHVVQRTLLAHLEPPAARPGAS